jgi:1,4-dihydroxy-6-naphthoate synthase
MRQHIDLYVNHYSLELGETGKAAVNKLLKVHQTIPGVNVDTTSNIFLDNHLS